MNKLFAALVFSAAFVCTASAKELIKNGNFAELVKTRIGGQEEMFPKHFEVYGSSVKNHKVVKTAKGHEVWSKGVLAVGFGVPKGMPEGSVYTLVVRAKGQGKIGVRTWSWEGHSARKNHRHLNLPKQALTESWHDYTFKIPYLPKETYMIVYIDGNVTLENISCTIAKE